MTNPDRLRPPVQRHTSRRNIERTYTVSNVLRWRIARILRTPFSEKITQGFIYGDGARLRKIKIGGQVSYDKTSIAPTAPASPDTPHDPEIAETIEDLTPVDRKEFYRLWPRTKGHRIKRRTIRGEEGGPDIHLDVFKGHHNRKINGKRRIVVEFKTREQADAFVPPEWFGAVVKR